MAIRVEFFGVARQRAGIACVELPSDSSTTLGRCLSELAGRYPAFGRECVEQAMLKPAYTANLGGARFVRDPQTALADGQTLLILSADAGG